MIENLHSAHQGVSGMYSRAQSIIFWPGMAAELDKARNMCRSCNRNAPSQAKLPPTASEVPNVPFQMIFADYCQMKGNKNSGFRRSLVRMDRGNTDQGWFWKIWV